MLRMIVLLCLCSLSWTIQLDGDDINDLSVVWMLCMAHLTPRRTHVPACPCAHVLCVIASQMFDYFSQGKRTVPGTAVAAAANMVTCEWLNFPRFLVVAPLRPPGICCPIACMQCLIMYS